MTSAEVLKYYGEPSSREVEEHDIRSGGRVIGTTQLHIWTYKRGTGDRHLHIIYRAGHLASVPSYIPQ
jgi:hypothetical protein